jgi:acyl-coenzyme A synthetase/AMP-(fatty) acid ligase
LDPFIQVEAVVQEKAKGQVASRETVIPTSGTEVRIVNDEQKKQQEAEEGQITPRSGAGEAWRSAAEAI